MLIMKRLLQCLFLVILVGMMAMAIWFYSTKLNHKSRFESVALKSHRELQLGKKCVVGMDTYNDGILSREIIDIFLSTEQKLTKQLKYPPKIIYWRDEEGYPGLILVWAESNGFIALDVFQANDNDSIYLQSGLGLFTLPSQAYTSREGHLSDVETVIEKDRFTWRRWSEIEAFFDRTVEPVRDFLCRQRRKHF